MRKELTMNTFFTTPDMSCGGCANNIRRVLSREAGVRAVDVTLAAKRIDVAYDPDATSPERLAAALAAAGYPPAAGEPAADASLS
jgi:copper chaperone CopZ